MNRVRFFGPIKNRYSGYGNAVNNFSKAFIASGIETKFMFNSSILKTKPHLMQYNLSKEEFNIDFYLHCPPWNKHNTYARYKIAYFYWETDKLPSIWSRNINFVDEIWAPCNLVKNVCMRAGFRGDIKVVPTPSGDFATKKIATIRSPFSSQYAVAEDVFKFYSIFQWHERKGFRELLSAYYKEFDSRDRVILILKVNALDMADHTVNKISSDILTIKRRMNLEYYPPVYLVDAMLNKEELFALHNTGDCYVSPHHGEGWGIPIHDAMTLGKQIITTQFGGVTESLSERSAHIINHSIGPVYNMKWSPLYNKSQNWAHPSINHLQELMRDVYENHDEYEYKSKNAKKIAGKMTIDRVAKIIKREISRIKC